MQRSRAFTLIELLVVIAIIGILAAMVFPVFARARESARKAVCLSNVKNIALAIQMYLSDNNDTLPPKEHRQEVLDWSEAGVGGGPYAGAVGIEGYCWPLSWGQPYLQWPVVLDEYIKNRDVWRCPSAKTFMGACFIYGQPDWLGYLRQYEGQWGWDAAGGGPCMIGYPTGWGGSVTDSVVQGRLAVFGEADQAGEKAFVQSIATNWSQRELKLAAVENVAGFAIISDGGVGNEYWYTVGGVAYPEICALECGNEICSVVDWENPDTIPENWSSDTIQYYAPYNALDGGVSWRRPYARHFGGVNVGFLDGHAQWINSETLLSMRSEGDMGGIPSFGPYAACGFPDLYPGVPTLY